MDRKQYYRQLCAAGCIVLGAFLLIEHLFRWGGFDFNDLIGHEYYGLALMIIGFIVGGINGKRDI